MQARAILCRRRFFGCASGSSSEIENSRLVLKQGGERTAFNGSKRYEIRFRTLYAVDAELTGMLLVPADAEELVAAYNAGNGFAGAFGWSGADPVAEKSANRVRSLHARSGRREPFVLRPGISIVGASSFIRIKSKRNRKIRKNDYLCSVVLRRGARVVEEARLESSYTSQAYQGFESPSLRNKR